MMVNHVDKGIEQGMPISFWFYFGLSWCKTNEQVSWLLVSAVPPTLNLWLDHQQFYNQQQAALVSWVDKLVRFRRTSGELARPTLMAIDSQLVHNDFTLGRSNPSEDWPELLVSFSYTSVCNILRVADGCKKQSSGITNNGNTPVLPKTQ